MVRRSDCSLLTLNSLLQALQGARLRLELRDECEVWGLLEEADPHMK